MILLWKKVITKRSWSCRRRLSSCSWWPCSCFRRCCHFWNYDPNESEQAWNEWQKQYIAFHSIRYFQQTSTSTSSGLNINYFIEKLSKWFVVINIPPSRFNKVLLVNLWLKWLTWPKWIILEWHLVQRFRYQIHKLSVKTATKDTG